MVTLVLVGVGVIAAAIGTYLFLRNNPNKKEVIDQAVDKIKKAS